VGTGWHMKNYESKKPLHNKENKPLLKKGKKSVVGQIFSEYLRGIGTEVTELCDVTVDPDTKERRLVSKAEALARDIWNEALNGEDARLRLDYRKMIIERTEGKVAAQGKDDGPIVMDVPDRISELNRDRVNNLAS